MRSLKGLSIFVCVLMTVALAVAGTNSMGVRDVSHVTFVAPVRVGTVVLPAGDYAVRHTMEGEITLWCSSVRTARTSSR